MLIYSSLQQCNFNVSSSTAFTLWVQHLGFQGRKLIQLKETMHAFLMSTTNLLAWSPHLRGKDHHTLSSSSSSWIITYKSRLLKWGYLNYSKPISSETSHTKLVSPRYQMKTMQWHNYCICPEDTCILFNNNSIFHSTVLWTCRFLSYTHTHTRTPHTTHSTLPPAMWCFLSVQDSISWSS